MKKWNNMIALSAAILLFSLFNIATSKVISYPCENQVIRLLRQDSLVPSYYYAYSRDTIIIMAYKDSNWEQKTLQVCKLLNDSCNQSGYKILVVDTTSNRSFFDTPYGKKIYWRQCQ